MTSVSKEELAAWADGEVTGQRGVEITALVAADPALQAQVQAHLALKARLAAHFAPIAEAPVPDQLARLLQSPTPAPVIDLAAVRADRAERRRLPRWTWLAAPALAASIALAVVLPAGGDAPADGYAGSQLARVLDNQLVATQGSDAATRVLLSFRDAEGTFCRAYSASDAGGIACRDDNGWRIVALGAGGSGQGSEYRQAGVAEVLAAAQAMADGPALDAAQEEAARANGWR